MANLQSVANHFLQLAEEKNNPLTPMQLLKLVYIAHGWMLGLYGRPLIKEEVQAWQYGPVIPDLYNDIRKNGGQHIRHRLKVRGEPCLDGDEKDVIDQTFSIYGRYSGPALSRLTHAKGTPWDKVYEPGTFGLSIPVDLIEDHYASMAKKYS